MHARAYAHMCVQWLVYGPVHVCVYAMVGTKALANGVVVVVVVVTAAVATFDDGGMCGCGRTQVSPTGRYIGRCS